MIRFVDAGLESKPKAVPVSSASAKSHLEAATVATPTVAQSRKSAPRKRGRAAA